LNIDKIVSFKQNFETKLMKIDTEMNIRH